MIDMCELTVDEVKVSVEGFEPSYSEIRQYIKMAREESDKAIDEIVLKMGENGCIDMDYRPKDTSFIRIRRVSGYLSTLDRFNDAKQAEVDDRVKHDVGDA